MFLVFAAFTIHVFFLERFITHTVFTRCTRINYKIVPITNFNKYLHYGTNGNEQYVNMGVNNGSEK